MILETRGNLNHELNVYILYSIIKYDLDKC